MRIVNLIYPKKLAMSSEAVLDWYADALAEGKVARNELAMKGDLTEAIAELEDAGLISVEGSGRKIWD